MSARWSVITVTKDSVEDLQQFWNSDIPDYVEWIVIDNASTDGSVELARDLGATIVVPLKENMGFSAGCNVGLKLATAELTVFANPDVQVRYQDLGKFAEILAVEEVLIAPQLLHPNGEIQHNGRGNPHLLDKVLGRLNAQFGRSLGYYKECDVSETLEVEWVIGACLAGATITFRELGGWDENYFLYYEDADLCLRARKNGVRTQILGGVRWVHGWARATTNLNFGAWLCELESMALFYGTYPEFLLPKIKRVN